MTASKPLEFDPIDEARRQWVAHGWADAAEGMALVTSIFRAQQIYLARIDAVLRHFELSFARFELLTLLSFTKSGALPMNKIGRRLQVHPTSVTSTVDRLEAQGFASRRPHPSDRRTTLVEISPAGRHALRGATRSLNEKVFAAPDVSSDDGGTLFAVLRSLRISEGDFTQGVEGSAATSKGSDVPQHKEAGGDEEFRRAR